MIRKLRYIDFIYINEIDYNKLSDLIRTGRINLHKLPKKEFEFEIKENRICCLNSDLDCVLCGFLEYCNYIIFSNLNYEELSCSFCNCFLDHSSLRYKAEMKRRIKSGNIQILLPCCSCFKIIALLMKINPNISLEELIKSLKNVSEADNRVTELVEIVKSTIDKNPNSIIDFNTKYGNMYLNYNVNITIPEENLNLSNFFKFLEFFL